MWKLDISHKHLRLSIRTPLHYYHQILVRMTATTFSQFNGDTEGLEVAQAFSEQVSGKVVLVTGVNRGGIGYSTAEALVREKCDSRSI